jgi:Ca2+:H+ antiporter
MRHGLLRFNLRAAGLNAALMILAVAGLLLPAVFGSVVRDQGREEELSIIVAIILLLSYMAYLAFLLRGRQAWLGIEKALQQSGAGTSEWSVTRSLLALAAATIGTALVSEVLVSAVTPVTEQLGWTEFFVGVVAIPIVGNAAENWAAVRAGWHNHVDLTLGITSGSSTQIPLFVTPVLILVSLAIGRPMTLVFTPLELLVLALSTGISAYICLDGESHWLEGMLLLAVYAMSAAAFFLLPVLQAG